MDMSKGVGVFIVAFVVIILGVTFLTTIADTTQDITSLKTVENESIAVVNNTDVELANRQLSSFTLLRCDNSSANMTVGTGNYTVRLTPGTINVNPTDGACVGTAEKWLGTYTYRDIGDSTSRTFISLLPLFMALAVFLFTIGMFIPQFREFIGIK